VGKSTVCLAVGSLEAYSGKSAVILGIAHQLQQRDLDIAYAKPIGGNADRAKALALDSKAAALDNDAEFIAATLGLKSDRCQTSLINLDPNTLHQRVVNSDLPDYAADFSHRMKAQGGDLTIIEGGATLDEGRSFGLALPDLVKKIDGKLLLVIRYHALRTLDDCLTARQRLGDRLLGVIINDVTQSEFEFVNGEMRQFLELSGITVFGVLPSSTLLRSVSVEELVGQLNAEVLCRKDRLDLMVEKLVIGAMNVNSALKYFRQGQNMAVVTGGDRTDLQLAALETSTQCLILTGHIPPSKTILARADEMEIPILSVDLDTLTTVEIIDNTFGQVRLHEPIKVDCMFQMAEEYIDIDRLIQQLGLSNSLSNSLSK
jgi:uncharacterized protein